MGGRASYKKAFEKINEVNKEMDQVSMNRVREHHIMTRRLKYFFVFIALLGVAVFIALVHIGVIVLKKPIAPEKIAVVSAQSSNYGQLRLMINAESGPLSNEHPSFKGVRAVLIDVEHEITVDVVPIPVYLKNQRPKLLIVTHDLPTKPGPCNIEVTIQGDMVTSNMVQITQLQQL